MAQIFPVVVKQDERSVQKVKNDNQDVTKYHLQDEVNKVFLNTRVWVYKEVVSGALLLNVIISSSKISLPKTS